MGALSSAIERIRRDVTSVRRRLSGERSAPLVRVREPASPSPSPTTRPGAARELVVARVVRETENVVTLVLRAPDGAPFRFAPGQFFTVTVDGLSRNYSASNAPGEGELHLTIKEKESGRVSPRLCRIAPGARLAVAGPYGSFTVPASTSGETPRALVLVAGGVGITPLWSIAQTVLAAESGCEVALLYGSRSEADVVFAEDIDALAQSAGERFRVRHVLESVEGRLDRAMTARLFAELPASFADADVLVCGPDAMMTEVLAALASLGVPDARIRTERFVVASRLSAPDAAGVRTVAILAGGREHRAVALAGATLLDTGLAAGAPMPFSCSVGGCGACRVRLLDGTVTMEEPNCLTPAEREAGWVLACVGRPGAAGCSVRIDEEA